MAFHFLASFFANISASSSCSSLSISAPLLGLLPWSLACRRIVSLRSRVLERRVAAYQCCGVLLLHARLEVVLIVLLLTFLRARKFVGYGAFVLCVVLVYGRWCTDGPGTTRKRTGVIGQMAIFLALVEPLVLLLLFEFAILDGALIASYSMRLVSSIGTSKLLDIAYLRRCGIRRRWIETFSSF